MQEKIPVKQFEVENISKVPGDNVEIDVSLCEPSPICQSCPNRQKRDKCHNCDIFHSITSILI